MLTGYFTTYFYLSIDILNSKTYTNSVMNKPFAFKFIGFVFAATLSQMAMSQVEGPVVAGAPTVGAGDELIVAAPGDIYATAPAELLSARLYVDGSLVWSNGGKGVLVPTTPLPGLVFNYSPPYYLTSGWHTVVWEGLFSPVTLGHTGVLWSYSVDLYAP